MGELLTQLGIDWRLFLMQVVNFLLLLFVLYKLLYQPLIDKMEERREQIKQSLIDAKRVEVEKKKIETIKKEKVAEGRAKAEEVIEEARAKAESVEKDLIQKATDRAEQIKESARKEAQAEKTEILREARQEIAHLVIRASEKLTNRLLRDELDRGLVEDTINDLNNNEKHGSRVG